MQIFHLPRKIGNFELSAPKVIRQRRRYSRLLDVKTDEIGFLPLKLEMTVVNSKPREKITQWVGTLIWKAEHKITEASG